MHKHLKDEPEDAGLIRSKPPTKKELREISQFIAQSKQRRANQINEVPLPAERQQPQEEDL